MSFRLCCFLAVASWALLLGCDGSSPGSATSGDGGADMAAPAADAADDVTPSPPDLGVDLPRPVADSAADGPLPAICSFDAAIPLLPEFPDAGRPGGDGGAGDGGAGLAACLPCVATKCRAQINACLDNCACRVAFAGFAQCLVGGKAVLECAASIATLPPPVGSLAQAPLICAYASCGADCGLALGR